MWAVENKRRRSGGARFTTAGQAAGGQSVAQTCHKARQSVAQPPGRVFFLGSSFLPSASIGCLRALLGRQTSTVALKEKRKRGDNQEVRKGMKTGDAELSDASVTGQRGKECRVTGSHTEQRQASTCSDGKDGGSCTVNAASVEAARREEVSGVASVKPRSARALLKREALVS